MTPPQLGTIAGKRSDSFWGGLTLVLLVICYEVWKA
jgi:hypothetical protein